MVVYPKTVNTWRAFIDKISRSSANILKVDSTNGTDCGRPFVTFSLTLTLVLAAIETSILYKALYVTYLEGFGFNPRRSTTYVDAANCLHGVASSVGLSRSWALQKRLNRSRCRFGYGIGWAQPRIRWGAHWHNLTNVTEPSVCGGDVALCHIRPHRGRTQTVVMSFNHLLFLKASWYKPFYQMHLSKSHVVSNFRDAESWFMPPQQINSSHHLLHDHHG